MIGVLLNRTVSKGQALIAKHFLTSMIDVFGDDIVIIDTNRSNKTDNLIGFKVRHIIKDKENWDVFYNKCKESCSDLTALVIFSSIILGNLRQNEHSMLKMFDDNFDNGVYDKNLNFMMTANIYSKYMIIKACKDLGCKISQFVIDPQEIRFPEYLETGKTFYIMNKDTMIYKPSYEYELFKTGYNNLKFTDFLFYCTALTKDREYILDHKDYLSSIDNSDVGISTSVNDITYIPQNIYYDRLASSKYTLIIPSYDITAFSMIRFFEAIAYGCVPLVLDMCDLTDVKNTFSDIYDAINELGLVVSIDNIKETIKSLDYDLVFKSLNNLESIRNVKNLDYIKEQWREMYE